MLERDPQVLRDRDRRRATGPLMDHRVLHPFEVGGIVDMTHVVDVGGVDRNDVTEHCHRLSSADSDVNNSRVRSTLMPVSWP